jgi:hypothetical protein
VAVELLNEGGYLDLLGNWCQKFSRDSKEFTIHKFCG